MTEPTSVRPPLQARSRRTLSRIVQAGLALMAEGGPENVTVQKVVSRARVSVGSFYARFPGREELLHHLASEAGALERARWEASLEGHLTGGGLEERVRAIVMLLVSVAGDAPHEAHADLYETVARLLLDCRNEIRHPQPEAAVELGYAAVRGAVRWNRPLGWPDERLRDELARMWLNYLGGPRGGEHPRGRVDYFDVWA